MTDPKYTLDRHKIVYGLFGLEMPVQNTSISNYQQHGISVLDMVLKDNCLNVDVPQDADLNELFDIMEADGINLTLLYSQLLDAGHIEPYPE